MKKYFAPCMDLLFYLPKCEKIVKVNEEFRKLSSNNYYKKYIVNMIIKIRRKFESFSSSNAYA